MAEKENELGALWIKHSDTGEYMTGSITIDGKVTPIVCFLNRHKKEAKHPDWRILKSQPRGERSPAPEENRERLNSLDSKGRDPEPRIEYPEEEIDPNDIPF
jgi:uncharacterized protein (DUF736 family)